MKTLNDYKYYETKNGILYLGRNEEILPLIEQKINLVFTSPPYNIGQGNARRSSFFFDGDSKNDSKVYDGIDDCIPEEEYIKQQQILLKSLYDLLADDGAIFYNHKPRIQDGIWDDRKNLIPFPLRQEIVWQKSTRINFNGNFYVPTTERIYIIAKEKWKPNREFIGKGEVWEFSNYNKKDHPAPFPLALAMQVVASASQPDDIVLDPYVGSGTTALACERLKRKFIGIDISRSYLNSAIKDLKTENQQIKLF